MGTLPFILSFLAWAVWSLKFNIGYYLKDFALEWKLLNGQLLKLAFRIHFPTLYHNWSSTCISNTSCSSPVSKLHPYWTIPHTSRFKSSANIQCQCRKRVCPLCCEPESKGVEVTTSSSNLMTKIGRLEQLGEAFSERTSWYRQDDIVCRCLTKLSQSLKNKPVLWPDNAHGADAVLPGRTASFKHTLTIVYLP